MTEVIVQPQPLSQGPDLHVEKGVHIIFVGPEVQSPGPLATPLERADIVAAVGSVQKSGVIRHHATIRLYIGWAR